MLATTKKRTRILGKHHIQLIYLALNTKRLSLSFLEIVLHTRVQKTSMLVFLHVSILYKRVQSDYYFILRGPRFVSSFESPIHQDPMKSHRQTSLQIEKPIKQLIIGISLANLDIQLKKVGALLSCPFNMFHNFLP